MSYSASLIAYAFVKKGIEEDRPVTQMKLQKMVFFAQGVHLATHGDPLIDELFQAWKYGPVIPKIYHDYKYYGSLPILDTDMIFTASSEEKELATLSKKAIETIDYTWESLKKLGGIKLSNWTHKEGSPWKQTYIPGTNDEINNDLIKTYFENFLIEK
jgi:uncharacterized phage-associated protein